MHKSIRYQLRWKIEIFWWKWNWTFEHTSFIQFCSHLTSLSFSTPWKEQRLHHQILQTPLQKQWWYIYYSFNDHCNTLPADYIAKMFFLLFLRHWNHHCQTRCLGGGGGVIVFVVVIMLSLSLLLLLSFSLLTQVLISSLSVGDRNRNRNILSFTPKFPEQE